MKSSPHSSPHPVRAGQTGPLNVTREERAVLRRWSQGRDRRLAQRAALVLAASEGRSDLEMARRFRVSRQTVNKWRARFEARRLDGLVDEPRPGAPRRISDNDVERVLMLTRRSPPAGLGRWTTRSMARASGLSQTAISRIWRRHGYSPRGRVVAAQPAGLPDTSPPGMAAALSTPPAKGPEDAADLGAALKTLARAAESHPDEGAPLRRVVEALSWASRAVALARGPAGMGRSFKGPASASDHILHLAAEAAGSRPPQLALYEAVTCSHCGGRFTLRGEGGRPDVVVATVLTCPASGCGQPIEVRHLQDAADIHLE